MENLLKNIREYPLYLGMLFLVFSLNSCSDEDDGTIDEPEDNFTGSITANDQTVSANTIVVQSVSVGQDSWLAAVRSGEEDSDNFIAGPVEIEEGTASDVVLTLDADANVESGTEIVLKLYAEDDDGILGEWDIDDEPITDDSGVLATETITVTMEQGNAGDFASFDENDDNMLDENEVPNTYQNNFDAWDADEDGSLSEEEFYNTTFGNTDADDDDGITEEEWNAGYAGMYGGYVEEGDFSTFDADGDGVLNSDEWNQGFTETEWYGTYDADDDSLVTDTEWDAGLFGDWDVNDDDMIDEDEFNTYGDYVANW